MHPLLIKEIAKHILSFIEIKGSANFANTCKSWRDVHKESIKMKCHGEIDGKFMKNNYELFNHSIDDSVKITDIGYRMYIEKYLLTGYNDKDSGSHFILDDINIYGIDKQLKICYMEFIVTYSLDDIDEYYFSIYHNAYTSYISNKIYYGELVDIFFSK